MKKNVLNFAALLLLVFSLVGCKNESPSLEVQAEPEVVTPFKPPLSDVPQQDEPSEYDVVLDGKISLKLTLSFQEGGIVRVVDKRHHTYWNSEKKSGGKDFSYKPGEPLEIKGLRPLAYVLYVYDSSGNLLTERGLDFTELPENEPFEQELAL